MVRQPEGAEDHHDGQDEFLTADAAAELSLSDFPQDADVTRNDYRVWD